MQVHKNAYIKETEIRLSNQITVELYDQLVYDLNIRNAWENVH